MSKFKRLALLLRASWALCAWLFLIGTAWADPPEPYGQNLQLYAPTGSVAPWFLRNRPVTVGASKQGYQRASSDPALNFRSLDKTKMSWFAWYRVSDWYKQYPTFFVKGNYDATATDCTYGITTGPHKRLDWYFGYNATNGKAAVSFNFAGGDVNFINDSEFCLAGVFDGNQNTDATRVKMWSSDLKQTQMKPLTCASNVGSLNPNLPSQLRAGAGPFRVGAGFSSNDDGLDGSVSNLLMVDGAAFGQTEMERLRNNGMPLWIGPAAVNGGILTRNVSLLDLNNWATAGVRLADKATYLLTAQTKPYQNGYWTYNRSAPVGYKFTRPAWFSNWHRAKSSLGHGTNNGVNYDFYAITGPPLGKLCASALESDGTPLTCTKINQTTGPTAYSAWSFDEASGDAIDYGNNKLNLPRLTGDQAPATYNGVLGFVDQSPLALKFYAGAPRRVYGTNVSGERRAEITYEARWLPDGGGPGVGGLTGNPRDTSGLICPYNTWCDYTHMSAHITFKLLVDLPVETFFLYTADDASQHVFTGAENATDPTHNPVSLGAARIGQLDNQWILWGVNTSVQSFLPKHKHATTWRYDCSDIYGPLSGTGSSEEEDPYVNGDRLNGYEDIIPACKANGYISPVSIYFGLFPGNIPIVTGNSYVCSWATVNDEKGSLDVPGTHRHWINGEAQKLYVNAGGATPAGISRGALTNLPSRNLIGISVPKSTLLRGIAVYGDLTEDQVISIDQDLVPLKDQ